MSAVRYLEFDLSGLICVITPNLVVIKQTIASLGA